MIPSLDKIMYVYRLFTPEALIEKREAFNVCKFLQSYCKDQELDYKELYSKYEDFTYKFSDKLQRDFDEQNEFQTSMRGLKVRGVYDTRQAAEARRKDYLLQIRNSMYLLDKLVTGYHGTLMPMVSRMKSFKIVNLMI